jgi:hypothetical protein
MSSFKMDSDAKKKLDSYLRKHRGHSLSALNKMGMQVNPIVSNKIKIGRFIIEEMPQKMLKGSKGGNISTPTTPPGAIISAWYRQRVGSWCAGCCSRCS